MTGEWALFLLAGLMLATGLAGGIIAGMLGVGGGIVIVPVLDFALGFVGVDADIRMQVAVATSLATIIPTALSSARAHQSRGAVDMALIRHWAVAMFCGALIGTVIASEVQGSVLSAVFAAVCLLVVAKMLLPLDHRRIAPGLPPGPLMQGVPLAIGGVSSMMGIGGGTVGVPILTLFGYSIHRAVGTASLFGLLIAVPGTLGFIVTGWGDPRLPMGSLGFVNLIGLALIAPTTYLTAPLGARIAHGLSKRQLGIAFGLFLLLVACRMIYRVYQG
ncbi:sulfite exporter TauE/SafE family protein [Govanella unica]|uniref:Probable membrane transporter protein n=1 Tax=Govanella unica TaxID=2975056 RepID=A0A9X3U008_9PROT|nr:sulfite exporter TauE/SafE family protein [Govania unica]MDA5194723.1 sulfite exporter TauE/SafE family protein [Govania unica]